VLTTNRGLADWGEIFDDTTVATASLDGLLTTPPSCLSTATATG
jgi:phage tail protein X